MAYVAIQLQWIASEKTPTLTVFGKIRLKLDNKIND